MQICSLEMQRRIEKVATIDCGESCNQFLPTTEGNKRARANQKLLLYSCATVVVMRKNG